MLTIKISNFPDVRAEYAQASKEKKFSQLGGIIGRSTQCDWTLKDSSRRVSSKHIQIEYQFGEYYATDISTNGSKLNNLKMEKNVPIKLKTGDVIEIGLYKNVVANITKKDSDDLDSLIFSQDDSTSPSSELSFLDEHDLSQKSKALPFDKKADPSNLYQTRDVFSHLHNDEVFDPNKIGRKGLSQSEDAFDTSNEKKLLSDDSDSLNMLPENLFREEKEESDLNILTKTSSDFTGDEVKNYSADINVSKFKDNESDDEIQLQEFIDQDKLQLSKAMLSHVDELDLINLKKPNNKSEARSGEIPMSLEKTTGFDHNDFLLVFCKRTGINPKIIAQLDKGKLYQDISDILSYSLDGIIRLMMERNSAKSKLDSDLTMFTSQVKNPIKLSMSSKQALETILYDNSDSLMPARQAVGESVNEIVQHFQASDHSIKTVLDNLTSKLNPVEIEKKMLSGKKKLLSTLQNAKCWDEYKSMYESELGISKRQVEKNLKDLISDEYNKSSQ